MGLKNMQQNRRILLLSNDNFILGLLKGYSVANNLMLEELPSSKVLQEKDIKKDFQLIIIDARKLNSSLIRSNLKLLRLINNEYHIPICAIRDHTNNQLSKAEAWIDCFFEDPIMEQLDNYFRIRFRNSHPFPDRRYNERRLRKSERRSFLDPVKSIPSHYLRSISSISEKNKFSCFLGPFQVDKNCKSVFLKGKNLGLTIKEFNLFNLLAADVEHVFTADEIIKHLWPETDRANKSDLYQYMHLLRKKVEKDPDNPHWILTIKGVGYKLNINLDLSNGLNSQFEHKLLRNDI